MRIERIEIETLGTFRDAVYPISPSGITVILGPNESGKSTIMDSVRFLLYGRSKRASDRYGASGESVFAGQLTARDTNGYQWLITRSDYKHAGNSLIQRVSEEGGVQELRQLDIERELLGGVHPEMFRRLFAISLDELHAIHTLQGDELRAFLYDSGFQAGRSVVSSEQWLQQEMDRIYKPRGRTQPLVLTMNGIERVQKQKREAGRLQGKLELLYQEQEYLQQRRLELFAEKEQWKREGGLAERALHVSDDWVSLLTVKVQLAEWSESEGWQSAWDERWDRLVRQREVMALREEQLEQEKHRTAVEERRVLPNKAVLRLGPEVKRLMSMTETVRHWADSARELEHERNVCEAELWLMARQTDPDWTPEQLCESNVSQSFVNELKVMHTEEEQVRTAKIRSAEEHERVVREWKELNRSYLEAVAAIERHMADGVAGSQWSPSENEMERIQRLWGQLQQVEEGTLVRVQPDMASVGRTGRAGRMGRKESKKTNWISILVLLVMGIGAGAVLALNGQWVAASVLFGLGVVGAGIQFVLQSASTTDSPNRIMQESKESVDQQINIYREEIVQALKLVLPIAASRHQGERKNVIIQAAWQSVLTWQETSIQLARRKQSAEDAAEQAERRVRISTQETEAVLSRAAVHEQTWLDWLQKHGLPLAWSAASVQDHLRRVEQAIQVQQQIKRLLEREQRLWEQVQSYWNQCCQMIDAARAELSDSNSNVTTDESAAETELWGEYTPGNSIASLRFDSSRWSEIREILFAAMGRFLEHVEQEEDLLASSHQLEHKRMELALQLEAFKQDQSQLTIAQQQLWHEAGVNDEDAFLAKQRQAVQYYLSREKLIQLEASCYRGGEIAAFAPVEELLTKYDKSALEQRIAEIQEGLHATEEQLLEIEQQFGRLQQETESLKQRFMEEQAAQEQASLEAQLHIQAERYAVLAIAKNLIRRTRNRYEEEKQPHVFQRASHYLQHMTKGEYVRVLTPFGTQDIAVERRDGKVYDSLQLSRGTAEQVYLAMRFALADTMSERAPLPFVWDDIFVNFDNERLRATLVCLPELLEHHQIIWTTCHPHMVDVLLEVIPDAHVLRLNR